MRQKPRRIWVVESRNREYDNFNWQPCDFSRSREEALKWANIFREYHRDMRYCDVRVKRYTRDES